MYDFLYCDIIISMGQGPSAQLMEKYKSQRIDLASFQAYLSKVNSEDDI